MLNRMCSAPAMQEHVGDELPDPPALDHALGDQPEILDRAGATVLVTTNTATLTMMIHLTAKVIGPGPNE